MPTYTFYIEGLNREVDITAPTEKKARYQL